MGRMLAVTQNSHVIAFGDQCYKYCTATDLTAEIYELLNIQYLRRVYPHLPSTLLQYTPSLHNSHLLLISERYTGNLLSLPDLTLDDFRHFVQSIGSAIGHLHRAKMIHRDIKPENILWKGASRPLNPRSNASVVVESVLTLKTPSYDFVLCDFGSAKICAHTDALVMSENVGTKMYEAPELRDGQPYSPRTDTWSFGSVIFFVQHRRHLVGLHDDVLSYDALCNKLIGLVNFEQNDLIASGLDPPERSPWASNSFLRLTPTLRPALDQYPWSDFHNSQTALLPMTTFVEQIATQLIHASLSSRKKQALAEIIAEGYLLGEADDPREICEADDLLSLLVGR